MEILSYHLLYSKISQKFLSNRWLEKWNIDKQLMEKYIKSDYFKNILNKIVMEKNFSPEITLKLTINLLDNLSNGNSPCDWLTYIYQHALNKTFPDAVTIQLNSSLNLCCELYLRMFRILCDISKTVDCESFESKYPLEFLTPEEENSLENNQEYGKFINAFRHNYTYEMMELNKSVLGFNTIDHVCGVHYLSIYIARQMKAKGFCIDLGRVSGAAAGHDIGKYGCKGAEIKRVPYLHYYYTDQWFKRYGINYIRNIAVNHSTWDLELENLPLESLILIYSDFRVKNKGNDMTIYPLNESFKVILNKLDNVDDKKRKRYERVYEKLKDFEDFLISEGINTSIVPKFSHNQTVNLYFNNTKKEFSLLQGNEIVENLKFLAIKHNINLMYQLRDEYSLDKILEDARSENDWKNLREYIRIFEEYSTYLTQKQKIQTIKFLYENLTHQEDDIRRHCAELMGTLIAIFDEDYRKDIPENVTIDAAYFSSTELLNEYTSLLLFPGHKIIPTHKFWLQYSLSIMVESLFTYCKPNLMPKYRDALISYYKLKNSTSLKTGIFLLRVAKHIPLKPYDENVKILSNFVLEMLNKKNTMIRISALETASSILETAENDSEIFINLKNHFCKLTKRSNIPSENLLILKIQKQLGIDENIKIFTQYYNLDKKNIPLIFLSNLKTDTDWIKKKAQIDLLLENALETPSFNGLHTAIHFCNLLKVSEIEKVRGTAGAAILKIMPFLTPSERNEVSIELLRALEIEGNRFTEYIPSYVGQVFLFLQPKELDEVIDDLSLKVKNSNPSLKSLILKTIGITLSNYNKYPSRFKETNKVFRERLMKMLGILMNGLGDYNIQVKQSAFSVIGKDIFGSNSLTLKEKLYVLILTAKKILTLIEDNQNEELLFLSNSAGLNHIYRFIADYTFFVGNINIPREKKIAFFPGTFDPFSKSHMQIAKCIKSLGYEVYFAIDEFSWSKKTLPSLLRKDILSISISEELGMYIYPASYPTNIANSNDLVKLKENFKDSNVCIVVGSDVILNASSYKAAPSENSIHSFPHIIFERGKNKRITDAAKSIKAPVTFLTLPSKYSDISSTQIRNYIDENKDISSLISPLAESYIYNNGFYQREPQEKSLISSLWLKTEVVENITIEIMEKLMEIADVHSPNVIDKLKLFKSKPSARIILLINTANKNEIIGFSMFHWVRSISLYEEFRNSHASDYFRDKTKGRIIMIDFMYGKNVDKFFSLEQIILTETLSFAIAKDYECAVYNNFINTDTNSSLIELLKSQGFIIVPDTDENPIYTVNMGNPCVLNLDIENLIKEPFRSNIKIKHEIARCRRRLQNSLISLYPGELVLSFDTIMMHQSMVRKICEVNEVPLEMLTPKSYGKAMCVPYGDILDRYIIPNTVTKAIHTEKYFNADMKSFSISELPHYMDLQNQVRTLKSFNRPVILVDNVLHKGYRMKELDPLFKKENVEVQTLVAGIMSGKGKDLMVMQGRPVKSVYFIPRLKVWFNENALYPFIGGDSLWRGSFPKRNLLPSINLILPYTSPNFLRNADMGSVYNLSKTCIENSISILSSLEEEYHIIHERNLTLSNLGQVITIPRCVDHGKDVKYDLTISPSFYLQNDLELLNRLENVIF